MRGDNGCYRLFIFICKNINYLINEKKKNVNIFDL